MDSSSSAPDGPEETTRVRQWLQTVPSPTYPSDEYGGSRCRPPTQPTDEDLSPINSSTTCRSIFDQAISTALEKASSPASSISDYRSCTDSTPCKIRQALTFDGDEDSVQISDEEYDSSAGGSEDDRKEECHHDLKNAPNHKPAPHRALWVTSCLQCVLANLPCSRTLPACSRCVRNDRLCLPQRLKMHTELVRGDSVGNVLPIPLYFPHDDEETQSKKQALTEELMSSWMTEQDKKNWVLPTVGKLGGFPRLRWTKSLPRHPGEGIGIVTYRTRKPV